MKRLPWSVGIPWVLSAPVLFVLCLSAPCPAESSRPSPTGPYFGRKPPGMTPELFAPGIISTEAFEFAGSFSPDGKEYFFSRRPTNEGSENRIYVTRCVGARWSEPIIAPFAMNVFEFIPVVSPDGQTLFFYSERPKPDAAGLDGNLWVSQKTEQGWSDARYFTHPANRTFCMMVSAARNGTIYVSGAYDGRRGMFRSELRDGKYSAMEYLPTEVNAIRPVHPFIAPDESFLLMDAQPSGMGRPELFVSFRNADGSWTQAVNLGPAINATKTEFAGSVSPDGRCLFFHRRVNGNGEIYWVSAKVLDGLRVKGGK